MQDNRKRNLGEEGFFTILVLLLSGIMSISTWILTDDIKNSIYTLVSVPSLFLSVYATFFKGRKRGPKIIFSSPFQIYKNKDRPDILGLISNFGDTNTAVRVKSDHDVRFYSELEDTYKSSRYQLQHHILKIGDSMHVIIMDVPPISDDKEGVTELVLSYLDKNGIWRDEVFSITYEH